MQGECRKYVHLKFGSVYNGGLHIKIENKVVVGRPEVDNSGKPFDRCALGLENLRLIRQMCAFALPATVHGLNHGAVNGYALSPLPGSRFAQGDLVAEFRHERSHDRYLTR